MQELALVSLSLAHIAEGRCEQVEISRLRLVITKQRRYGSANSTREVQRQITK
jgi:hypothetical protein